VIKPLISLSAPEFSDDQKLTIGKIKASDKLYYIDYEGFVGHQPSLAGLWHDGQFEQFTFELMVEPESLHSTGTEPTFYIY